jgi:hypothetical protein
MRPAIFSPTSINTVVSRPGANRTPLASFTTSPASFTTSPASRRRYDITRVVYDITRVVYDMTRVVYDITRVVYDITRVVYDITRVVYDITRVVYDITRVVLRHEPRRLRYDPRCLRHDSRRNRPERLQLQPKIPLARYGDYLLIFFCSCYQDTHKINTKGDILPMPDKPFPRTEAERLLMMNKWVDVLTEYQVTLTITPAEMDQLTLDAETYGYLVQFASALSDRKEQFNDFKATIFNDDKADLPEAPSFASPSLPGPVEPGIIPRFRKLIQRVKVHPNYTEQIGEALDLIVDSPSFVDIENLIPELKFQSLEDEVVRVSFKKERQDGLRLEYRSVGDPTWQLAGIYTRSPGEHHVPSAIAGQPEHREYRGALIKGNQKVSQWSAIYKVVTRP